ncbi:MAG: hypothetical protein R3F29_08255 [Planctomycetota bacterium]
MKNMNAMLVGILFAIWSCECPRAQQTWKVSSSLGYGAQFSDLPQAVAAAAPGDVIWVYSVYPLMGFSNLYTAPTIDKPLTIIGFNVGLTGGSNDPTSVGLQGPLAITGIPAGERVVVTNVSMSSQWPVVSTISISDCAGSVILDDLVWNTWGVQGLGVEIDNCVDVVLRGAEFWLGSEAIEIRNSNVLMTTCWVEPWTAWGTYTTTAESIYLQNSKLTLAGSVVTARGGPAPLSAVVLDNSTLHVSPTTLVRGGYIAGTPGTSPGHFAPACLLTGTGTNEVQHDLRSPPTNYGTVQPTVTWQNEVIHDWVVADELFHVQVSGPPLGFAVLALGDYTPWANASTPGAPISGQLALDPFTAQAIDVVYFPTGWANFEWTFHCPALAENGHAFALQALTLSPAGEFGWTIPSPLTVGWDKSRTP